MTGARLPKMKKSYHSKAVPAEEAMTTRAIEPGWRRCSSAIVAIRTPSLPTDSATASPRKKILRRRE
jgi:hypothetical protein